MSAIIVLAAIAVYAVTWLKVARVLYGRWRAHSIDHNIRQYPMCYPAWDMAKTLEEWDRAHRGETMVSATLAAAVWPLAIPLAIVIPLITRWLATTPVLSQAEMRTQVAERDKRIAELEHEAGIRR